MGVRSGGNLALRPACMDFVPARVQFDSLLDHFPGSLKHLILIWISLDKLG